MTPSSDWVFVRYVVVHEYADFQAGRKLDDTWEQSKCTASRLCGSGDES